MTDHGVDEGSAEVGGVSPHQYLAVAPVSRARPIAWATCRAAPVNEAMLPRRNRAPAITGAARGVEIVASWMFIPRTRV